MIIVYGQSTCGKVDKVPNLFYVCTRFFHVYYVPLIPVQSYLVLAGSESGDGGFQGIPISMSFKSVLVGWMRAGLILAAIGLLIASIAMTVEMSEHGGRGTTVQDVLLLWALLAACPLAYWLTLRYTFAGEARAKV